MPQKLQEHILSSKFISSVRRNTVFFCSSKSGYHSAVQLIPESLEGVGDLSLQSYLLHKDGHFKKQFKSLCNSSL